MQALLSTKRLTAKRKDLPVVDHSQITYPRFEKNFYIEPAEVAQLTEEEVALLRIELDDIKIKGKRCPRPVVKWHHFGLPLGLDSVITKTLHYATPTPIQAQAIPAIMSGRDVIGVARTGSGKTVAFLLPMLRHIKNQPPRTGDDGPIGLIMAPTRELATQIFRDCQLFCRRVGLRPVCCYGGPPLKDQIADLKRGADVVVCTPGRMIDLLCANSGRVTNLRRVTFLVLDEADRMFDMGFEPQVMKIINAIQPRRQTVLFSATFPRKMEALARKVLHKPLEIVVGGKSVVSAAVTQIIEVRPEASKFPRLLEILGAATAADPAAKFLVFVDRQVAADALMGLLMRHGYPCQSLHGGKDQADRDQTIIDIKKGDTNLLVATSVAARGLDVKHLHYVVNYDCPDHMEDYVHRVGRTGRAGARGTAYTFICPDQEARALDVMKALKLGGQPVPAELQAMGDRFIAKIRAGLAVKHSSSFGGRGLDKLDMERHAALQQERKRHGVDDDEDDDEDDDAAGGAAAAAGPPMPTIADGTNPTAGMPYNTEIEINDYPQKARWRVTNRDKLADIIDFTGAVITTRGTYYPPGMVPRPNDRKLYLVSRHLAGGRHQDAVRAWHHDAWHTHSSLFCSLPMCGSLFI
ncbi:hypothetical protein CXG81DRAFT_11475 [Caulochytrium protostelioides]|uniref:RNA helicase n=1 Tax=Caulochytrium protostelioides TaxID=1555241 RepID=A0A4P9X940_9FUNG|nr:hypothetical protein CXG81DRAFT_11475 [Caulochytrium protostelioides]|eukprot:RKP01844.1 hypothetical protein CXG81DRAFT_11475 [Caulochytrium protostelioides]